MRIEWPETSMFPWPCPTIEMQLAAIEAFMQAHERAAVQVGGPRIEVTSHGDPAPVFIGGAGKVVHSKLAVIGYGNSMLVGTSEPNRKGRYVRNASDREAFNAKYGNVPCDVCGATLGEHPLSHAWVADGRL